MFLLKSSTACHKLCVGRWSVQKGASLLRRCVCDFIIHFVLHRGFSSSQKQLIKNSTKLTTSLIFASLSTPNLTLYYISTFINLSLPYSPTSTVSITKHWSCSVASDTSTISGANNNWPRNKKKLLVLSNHVSFQSLLLTIHLSHYLTIKMINIHEGV